MRFRFDPAKSRWLRRHRGIGFEEALELWEQPYGMDQRSENPEQYRVIGWVKGKLYTVIFEVRHDSFGEYSHGVTLWKSTREEGKLYEENVQ